MASAKALPVCRHGCRYGSFVRTVELPRSVNLDSIKAVMSKGVLNVAVPNPPPAQAKTIEVKAAG